MFFIRHFITRSFCSATDGGGGGGLFIFPALFLTIDLQSERKIYLILLKRLLSEASSRKSHTDTIT